MYLVRKGQIRPNTPVAWSYAKDDGYTFAPAVYADYAQGLIPKLTNNIMNAQESTGYQAPPSFQVYLSTVFQGIHGLLDIHGLAATKTDTQYPVLVSDLYRPISFLNLAGHFFLKIRPFIFIA